jgi:hypothetical protein
VQAQQNVGMVSDAVDPDGPAVAVLFDPAHVPEKILPARIRKHGSAVFGCEYKVIKNLRVGGHDSTPAGLADYLGSRFPQVSPTANDLGSLRDPGRNSS